MSQTSNQTDTDTPHVRFATAAFALARENTLNKDFQERFRSIGLTLLQSDNVSNQRQIINDLYSLVLSLSQSGYLESGLAQVLKTEVDRLPLTGSYQMVRQALTSEVMTAPASLAEKPAGPAVSSSANTSRLNSVIQPTKTSSNASSSSASSRRQMVLVYLRDNPLSSVSDVAKAVGGVSTKTIQRELVSLVEENKVIKEGEKRWSRYSLA